MAGGWTRDGAVQDQIDDTVMDAVLAARARLAAALAGSESETHCLLCGEEIPEGRRRALPGATTCVACQAERDRNGRSRGINRRASKDSQLK